jgi:hypothetical protein
MTNFDDKCGHFPYDRSGSDCVYPSPILYDIQYYTASFKMEGKWQHYGYDKKNLSDSY